MYRVSLVAALAAALVCPSLGAAQCPVGARIVGSLGDSLDLRDAKNQVTHLALTKGLISPPLVVTACSGRFYIVESGGQKQVVLQAQAILDQSLDLPICAASASGGETHIAAVGNGATDGTCRLAP